MEEIKILGVKMSNVGLNEALGKAAEFLASGNFHHIATPNPEIVLAARKDKKFLEILNKADLSLADGVGLIFAAKFLGTPFKERITGIDFMVELCGLAEKSGKNVFLLGGGEGIAEKAAEKLKIRFPRLKIAGTASGAKAVGFPPENVKADILFAALGAPKQEFWIAENAAKMPSVKIALGVGGAFDVVSGRLSRAPLFLRKIGLEWLWRLFLEPKRFKRIFNAVVVFPTIVAVIAIIYARFKHGDCPLDKNRD